MATFPTKYLILGLCEGILNDHHHDNLNVWWDYNPNPQNSSDPKGIARCETVKIPLEKIGTKNTVYLYAKSHCQGDGSCSKSHTRTKACKVTYDDVNGVCGYLQWNMENRCGSSCHADLAANGIDYTKITENGSCPVNMIPLPCNPTRCPNATNGSIDLYAKYKTQCSPGPSPPGPSRPSHDLTAIKGKGSSWWIYALIGGAILLVVLFLAGLMYYQYKPTETQSMELKDLQPPISTFLPAGTIPTTPISKLPSGSMISTPKPVSVGLFQKTTTPLFAPDVPRPQGASLSNADMFGKSGDLFKAQGKSGTLFSDRSAPASTLFSKTPTPLDYAHPSKLELFAGPAGSAVPLSLPIPGSARSKVPTQFSAPARLLGAAPATTTQKLPTVISEIPSSQFDTPFDPPSWSGTGSVVVNPAASDTKSVIVNPVTSESTCVIS